MSVIFAPVSYVTLVFLSFFSSMFLSNESPIRSVGLLVNDFHASRDIRVFSVAFSFASRWFSLVRSLHSSSFSLSWYATIVKPQMRKLSQQASHRAQCWDRFYSYCM